jgi:hypothetical protein
MSRNTGYERRAMTTGRHAAMSGGGWEWRVLLPSGLVAVVVPSGWRVKIQPHRWMAMR